MNPRIVKYFKPKDIPEMLVIKIGQELSAKGYSVDPCATALFVNFGQDKSRLLTESEAKEVVELVAEHLQPNHTADSIYGCARIDIVYQGNDQA